jgi:2-oxo-4-hydroxy-4-carboxy--5-ureidoimidazoline (OHCU) decarboxylase
MRRQIPAGLPPIEVLDQLDVPTFTNSLSPLFERAPRFLALLAASRPFGTDAALLAAAGEIARGMPEEVQIELLNAHPPIGADPATVSALSYDEQGFGAEPVDEASEDAATDSRWVDEELAVLNAAYESRFGFRFVVFVAGRERSEIVPLIERALQSDDRAAELRRGIDDVIDIAADRLARLRGPEAAE